MLDAVVVGYGCSSNSVRGGKQKGSKGRWVIHGENLSERHLQRLESMIDEYKMSALLEET